MKPIFPLLLLLFCCTGCMGPAPQAQFVRQAQRLHDDALASADTTNPDLRDYVQLVGKRIIAAACAMEPNRTYDAIFSRMQFNLSASAVPNVFTTGGAHVYVYSGFFEQCENEDELAAAMAHAYAHAINLDVEHSGMEPDPKASAAQIVWQFVIHRFTLAQERAADELAFSLYTRAGYEPGRFAGLFDHLAVLFPDNQSPDRMSLPQRAQEARGFAAQAPPGRRPLPVADPQTFLALRREAAQMNPSLASPEAQVLLSALPNCLLSGDTPRQQSAQQRLKPPPPPKRLEPS